MSIVKDKHNPADIAYIELTNVYSTLNQRLMPKYLEKQGFWSRMFSVITEDVLEERTRVLNKLDVQAGCRVHIRMGYGSLASLLPIGFNGVIAEIEVGETIMYVAQGDGVELVNDISNYGPDQTNSMFNVGVEPTDIIRRIMCKRGWAFHLDLDLFSRFILKSNADAVNGEYAFGTSSPYGIEHFGMVQKDQDGLFDLFGEIKVYDIMKNIYTTGIDIANINKMWVEATRNTTTYDITNEDLQKSWWDQVGEYFQGLWGRTDQVADEPNIGVWLGNKTPWDIFQILAKCTDGYICTAFPHQFRSSLFFGLTWWLVSVGYKLKSDVDSIDSLPEGPAGWGTGGTSYGGR
jgi:hypothetical protein